MKHSRGLVATFLFVVTSMSAREEFESPQEVKALRPIAAVDIRNTRKRETPAGTIIKEGQWRVDAEVEMLEASVEPIV